MARRSLIAVGVGLVAACTSFGAETSNELTPPPDGGSTSGDPAPGPSDGGVDAEDAPAETGPTTRSCINLRVTDGDFTSFNAEWRSGEGWVIGMAANGDEHSIQKTFESRKEIVTSEVDVTMRVDRGPATAESFWANGIAQYYGPNTVFDSSNPVNGLQLESGQKSYVDFWPSGGPGDAEASRDVPGFDFGALDGRVVLLTKWKEAKLSVQSGAVDLPLDQRVLDEQHGLGKSLSIEIGGIAGGSLPSLQYIVRELCVTFD